ncbi:anaerobic sulfatase maturase [Methanobacterium sp. CWC-01]|uniref:anaerobic sulfatase maturase n=1 Tax=Methanobacterium aridiramus TaxID=2584467 RepID=UPI00257597FA|nr:anaerobic sulfatase maturase [Methanobacterium sp. CWC-01]
MTESEYLVSFHLMAKPNGALCNLNCKYCFYTPKVELYQDREMEMSDEVLEEYTRQYIGALEIPEVTFAWQGGEPTLMGIEFFKKAIKFQQMYKKPGMKIYNTIQTNGTLLDKDWCEFFRENDFLVGISIDGPRDLHDAYRRDKKGNPSFDRVMHGLKLLKKYEVEFNILSTVNRSNADYPLEVYNFFKEVVGAKHIQFIPIVEMEDSNGKIKVSDESVLPEQYGKFLSTIFDEWVQKDVGKVYVQIYDAALASWVDYPPSVCLFAPTCGTALIIEHNGDIYSCDHFVDSEHLLGNIMETPMEELVSSSQQFQFGLDKKEKLPQKCVQCDFKFACYGACPKHRFLINETGEKHLNYLCNSYKEFFEHIKWPMEIMTSLLNHNRAPAEVMSILKGDETLKKVFPDIGRNDPCPCGSGLKFKKCHGKSG